MPAPRRHPLFLALMRPQLPIYPKAVKAIVWDADDKPVEESEGVVYLVSKPCARMRMWARKLRALHALDTTHETDEAVSALSLTPLRPGELEKIGVAERNVYGETGREVRTARAGYRLYWRLPLMLVVLYRAGGEPVGFVAFQLRWAVCADPEEDREVDLEVEPDQAWIAPEFRGRRWGELAAIALAMVTRKNVDQVHDSVRWPAGYRAELKVTVGADIYSTSGEAFLRHCAQYVAMEVDLLEGSRLEVNDVEFYPRW